MKVRLKRYYDYKTNYDIVCFNSMKVRLKQRRDIYIKMGLDCFNSMKVRLKLAMSRIALKTSVFQFHEGPIKTRWDMIYIYSSKVSIP